MIRGHYQEICDAIFTKRNITNLRINELSSMHILDTHDADSNTQWSMCEAWLCF